MHVTLSNEIGAVVHVDLFHIQFLITRFVLIELFFSLCKIIYVNI